MKIAIAQINPIVGGLDHNFKTILNCIERAKKEKANLVVFPEMALIGYPPKDLILKHGLIDNQNYYLNELALYTDSEFAIIVGGISLNTGFGRPYHNSLFCLANSRIELLTHKTLLPTYDVFDEIRYFEPSKKALCWDFMGTKFGLSICEDVWIEAYTNLYTRNPIEELIADGAQIIVNISASPYTYSKSKTRERLLTKVVERYQRPLIYVNQVGANDELIFDGMSLALDAKANIIGIGKTLEEDLLFVQTYDLIEAMSGLKMSVPESNTEELKKALILGLRDYVSKCGFSKVVLGLSGGIDSALVACLAAEACGKENTYAYMLASKFTSKESLEDAEKLAKNLGIHYASIPISDLHQSYQKLIPNLSGLADENIQPRIRANILMALANSTGAMLLNTSNKSELAVGYSTLYGDSCGALAVIGDVLKTDVYKLASNINSQAQDEMIPKRIIDRAPTAELKDNQQDSDSLPPYEVLDQIVLLYVQEMKSYKQIIDLGHDAETVKNVLNMIDRAEYKRRQSPPVLKVAGKAFGVGRRMPIAQGFKHK